MIVKVPVSIGELLDKMSILRIKLSKFKDADRIANVRRELGALASVAESSRLRHPGLEAELDKHNGRLWMIEDELRLLESRGDFGERFVELARGVYYTNDRRAAVKRKINEHFGSGLVEEKEYVDYTSGGNSEP